MIGRNGYKLHNGKYIVEQELEQDHLDSDRFPHSHEVLMKPEIYLHSERGADYTRLRDLLAAGQWAEADNETVAVLLKVSSREEEGWLNLDSIKSFPHADIRTIDQLWVNYSAGRFGFSVQKRIWQEVNEDWDAWCEAVGWSVRESMTFSLKAPEGHLPAGNWCLGGGLDAGNNFLKTIALLDLPGGKIWGLAISSLTSRLT